MKEQQMSRMKFQRSLKRKMKSWKSTRMHRKREWSFSRSKQQRLKWELECLHLRQRTASTEKISQVSQILRNRINRFQGTLRSHHRLCQIQIRRWLFQRFHRRWRKLATIRSKILSQSKTFLRANRPKSNQSPLETESKMMIQ